MAAPFAAFRAALFICATSATVFRCLIFRRLQQSMRLLSRRALRTDQKYFWGVFLILLSVYLSFALYHHVSTQYQDTNIDFRESTGYLTGDQPHYLIEVRSIVEHGTLDLTKAYQELNWPPDTWEALPGSRPGALPWHSIGLPILLVLPYLAAGVFGTMAFMCVATAAVGAQVFGLSNSIVRKPRYALVCALIFGVLFLLPFSYQIYPDMVASLIAIVVVRKIFVQSEWSENGLALTGGLIGFSILLNPKNIVLFAVPLFYVVFMSINGRRGRGLTAFAIPFLSFLLLYCYYTWSYFGSIFLSPYTSSYHFDFDFTSNGVLGLLIDREHGVLAYFPALYLGFLGLVVSARRLSWRAIPVGLMFMMFYALVAFYMGIGSNWKQGATTAGREILPLIILWSAPFSTSFVLFWKKCWFRICAVSLVGVTAVFSVAMTWYPLLGLLGGLYRTANSILGWDVGGFWPVFGTIFCPSQSSIYCPVSFRVYDYLFLAAFVGYTLLLTIVAGRANRHAVTIA